MYFCYTCYKYVEDLNEDTLPKVKVYWYLKFLALDGDQHIFLNVVVN